MKIFVSENHVDLEAPIQMTDGQLEKFKMFFKNMFEDVEIFYVAEVDREPPGPGKHSRWTADDYLALLNPDDNLSVAHEIGRSEMSIKMQRGNFVPDFLSWMKQKDYSFPYSREMIAEYKEDKGYR